MVLLNDLLFKYYYLLIYMMHFQEYTFIFDFLLIHSLIYNKLTLYKISCLFWWKKDKVINEIQS